MLLLLLCTLGVRPSVSEDTVRIGRVESQFRLNRMWPWFQEMQSAKLLERIEELEKQMVGLNRMHETKALPDASQTSVKIHQLDDHFHRSVGDRNQIEIDHTDRVEEIGRNEGISTEHEHFTENSQPQTLFQENPITGELITNYVEQDEEVTKVTEPPQKCYKTDNHINCGSNGFYQVDSRCYSFTFYRSMDYKDASQFCKASGGFLAVLETEEELQCLQEYLVDHVASNIYQGEVVTFLIGSYNSTEVDGGCAGGYGDCTGVTWNQGYDCAFKPTKTDCRLRQRFICERNPLV